MVVERVTDEEYLARERVSDAKSELLHGEVVAMAGGTRWHDRVGTALRTAVSRFADESGCESFSSDMRVRVPGAGYLYPDASYACGPIFDADECLLNPVVVWEVLSPSTEARDRGVKFDAYRRIESLRTYVLLSSTRPWAMIFHRSPAGWIMNEVAGREGEIDLPSIGLVLKMTSLYARIPDDPEV